MVYMILLVLILDIIKIVMILASYYTKIIVIFTVILVFVIRDTIVIYELML